MPVSGTCFPVCRPSQILLNTLHPSSHRLPPRMQHQPATSATTERAPECQTPHQTVSSLTRSVRRLSSCSQLSHGVSTSVAATSRMRKLRLRVRRSNIPETKQQAGDTGRTRTGLGVRRVSESMLTGLGLTQLTPMKDPMMPFLVALNHEAGLRFKNR